MHLNVSTWRDKGSIPTKMVDHSCHQPNARWGSIVPLHPAAKHDGVAWSHGPQTMRPKQPAKKAGFGTCINLIVFYHHNSFNLVWVAGWYISCRLLQVYHGCEVERIYDTLCMPIYGYLAISCVLHIHIPRPGQNQSCFTPHDANGRPMKKRHGRDSSGQQVLQVLVYPIQL